MVLTIQNQITPPNYSLVCRDAVNF